MITKILAAVIAVLLILAIWQRGSVQGAKRGEERAQEAQAQAERQRDGYARSAHVLATQAVADRKAMAEANDRAASAQEERKNAKEQADRTIAGLRAGELRLKSRLSAAQAQADAAGNPREPQAGTQCDLPAGFLEYVAGKLADADQVVIERNEAVAGWQACRVISDAAGSAQHP